MNQQEAAAVLAVAASFDNRKPDATAAMAWSVALEGVRFEDARDAVVAHYSTSGDWLMPHVVIANVKRIRDKRIADHPRPIPPADLDPVETNQWLRNALRRIGDGEVLSDDEVRGELKARHLPDLRALMPKPDTHPEPTDPKESK